MPVPSGDGARFGSNWLPCNITGTYLEVCRNRSGGRKIGGILHRLLPLLEWRWLHTTPQLPSTMLLRRIIKFQNSHLTSLAIAKSESSISGLAWTASTMHTISKSTARTWNLWCTNGTHHLGALGSWIAIRWQLVTFLHMCTSTLGRPIRTGHDSSVSEFARKIFSQDAKSPMELFVLLNSYWFKFQCFWNHQLPRKSVWSLWFEKVHAV